MAQTFAQYMAESGRQSELDAGATPESVGFGSSSGSYGSTFSSNYNNLKAEIDSYIKELEDVTNGDYDYIAKWLEANYKDAAGNDDVQRQKIIREVANDLETRVGRLGYDYETGKYRLNTEADTATTRLNQDTSTALSRLKEDEKVLTAQYNKEAEAARRQQGSTLNQRGILSSTREDAQGLAGQEVRLLEGDISDKFDSLYRNVARDTFDINQNQSRGLFDIKQAKTWGLQDLATTARRGYDNATDSYNQGIEGAQREKERRLAELKRQKYENYQTANTYAEALARRQTGAY